MTDTIDHVSNHQCISSHEEADSVSIKFTGPVTIESVGAVKAVLGEALLLKKKAALDGGEIEKIDTAAVQEIWSFIREVQRLDQSVTWVSASETLNQVAAWLGLADTLKLGREEIVGA